MEDFHFDGGTPVPSSQTDRCIEWANFTEDLHNGQLMPSSSPDRMAPRFVQQNDPEQLLQSMLLQMELMATPNPHTNTTRMRNQMLNEFPSRFGGLENPGQLRQNHQRPLQNGRPIARNLFGGGGERDYEPTLPYEEIISTKQFAPIVQPSVPGAARPSDEFSHFTIAGTRTEFGGDFDSFTIAGTTGGQKRVPREREARHLRTPPSQPKGNGHGRGGGRGNRGRKLMFAATGTHSDVVHNQKDANGNSHPQLTNESVGQKSYRKPTNGQVVNGTPMKNQCEMSGGQMFGSRPFSPVPPHLPFGHHGMDYVPKFVPSQDITFQMAGTSGNIVPIGNFHTMEGNRANFPHPPSRSYNMHPPTPNRYYVPPRVNNGVPNNYQRRAETPDSGYQHHPSISHAVHMTRPLFGQSRPIDIGSPDCFSTPSKNGSMMSDYGSLSPLLKSPSTPNQNAAKRRKFEQCRLCLSLEKVSHCMDVPCPTILQISPCPNCGAHGSDNHTNSHCPSSQKTVLPLREPDNSFKSRQTERKKQGGKM